jgi:hypothetical protein
MNLPKVGIVLLNYNLPKETDYVYDLLIKTLKKTNYDYEICVVDNASDKAPPSKYTTVNNIVNTRTMGGILTGAHYFNRKNDIKYVLYMHNDMTFDENIDFIQPMIEFLEKNSNVAVVHPSLNQNATPIYIGDRIVVHDKQKSDFIKLLPNKNDVINLDDTSPIIVRKEDWNVVGGQDHRLTRCYGSGKDFYTSLHKLGKEIFICNKVFINHHGQYTYLNNVGDESYQTLDKEAYVEMNIVMAEKYGTQWRTIFQ